MLYNYVADSFQLYSRLFFERSAILDGKRPFTVFEPPLGSLGATYDNYLTLIGKRVVDILLVLIELFSLSVTAEALRANIGSKSAISTITCDNSETLRDRMSVTINH